MLTYIMNVLGVILGVGICIVAISFGQKWTTCEAICMVHSKQASNCHLSEHWTPLPLLLVEQTPTALVVDRQRDSFGTAFNRSSTYPSVFFNNGYLPRRPSVHYLKHMTGVTK